MSSPTGTIVFLNGTSSSGKTALAKELQQLLEEPYVRMSLDEVFIGLNEWYRRKPERVEQFPVLGIVSAFHHAVAGYSRAGLGVIIDHCIHWHTGMQECIEIFRNARVAYVEVTCAVEVLREREKVRGDRRIGQAESQIASFEELRKRFAYDLRVDTSRQSPAECAQMVLRLVNDPTIQMSFERIRASHPRGGDEGRDE